LTGDLIYDQALIGDGKTTSCLITDHLSMLIGDKADWSLIGGGTLESDRTRSIDRPHWRQCGGSGAADTLSQEGRTQCRRFTRQIRRQSDLSQSFVL